MPGARHYISPDRALAQWPTCMGAVSLDRVELAVNIENGHIFAPHPAGFTSARRDVGCHHRADIRLISHGDTSDGEKARHGLCDLLIAPLDAACLLSVALLKDPFTARLYIMRRPVDVCKIWSVSAAGLAAGPGKHKGPCGEI